MGECFPLLKVHVCVIYTCMIVLISFNVVCAGILDTLNMSNSTVELANLSISLPPEVFNISSDNNEVGLILTSYRDTTLFQLTPPKTANTSDYNFTADSVVLGFAVAGTEVRNLIAPVNITLQALRALRGEVSLLLSLFLDMMLQSPPQNWSDPICVSWVFNTSEGEPP